MEAAEASAWARKVHGCLTPWQSMQNVWAELAYGWVSIPPGGAIEAPKDPDTRPGPPPSATVSLGMGMYRASAERNPYSEIAAALSPSHGIHGTSLPATDWHFSISKRALMSDRSHKTGMCGGRGAHEAGAGTCLQQSLVLSRGILRALRSLQCMQQHPSLLRCLALLRTRVWQSTLEVRTGHAGSVHSSWHAQTARDWLSGGQNKLSVEHTRGTRMGRASAACHPLSLQASVGKAANLLRCLPPVHQRRDPNLHHHNRCCRAVQSSGLQIGAHLSSW